jgi:pimeloyl-ACP methyl ester carboxylesterase
VTPDFAIEEGLGAAFAPGYDVPSEFVDDFHRQTYTSYDAVARAEDDYVTEEPLDRRLRGGRLPLLAIFGAEERIYDPRKALAAYGALPESTVRLVRGSGHSPNVEKPARTAALVLRFASRGTEAQEPVQNEEGVRERP